MPIRHRATSRFWREYDRLPAEVKDLADKSFALLRMDELHPVTHLLEFAGIGATEPRFQIGDRIRKRLDSKANGLNRNSAG